VWLKELESYEKLPPLQGPETYDLLGDTMEIAGASLECAPGAGQVEVRDLTG
jgi:hypothetical protein